MNFEGFKDILTAEFPDVTEKQLSQFRDMEALYLDWNSKINVISRKDVDGFYAHHVLHSLGIAAYWRREDAFETDEGTTVLDLGTGGGFPGIPLAVMYPQMQFTLCDSIGKKILVVKEVAAALGLENVTAVNARAEALPGKFDAVVSRAVTSLDNFYPWVKGKFERGVFYLKGGDINEELYTLMSRERMRKGSVSTWRLDSWLTDEYYKEKYFIHIVF